MTSEQVSKLSTFIQCHYDDDDHHHNEDAFVLFQDLSLHMFRSVRFNND
jgi:hypothetical protein